MNLLNAKTVGGLLLILCSSLSYKSMAAPSCTGWQVQTKTTPMAGKASPGEDGTQVYTLVAEGSLSGTCTDFSSPPNITQIHAEVINSPRPLSPTSTAWKDAWETNIPGLVASFSANSPNVSGSNVFIQKFPGNFSAPDNGSGTGGIQIRNIGGNNYSVSVKIFFDASLYFTSPSAHTTGSMDATQLPTFKLTFVPDPSDVNGFSGPELIYNFTGSLDLGTTHTCTTPDVSVPMGSHDVYTAFSGIGSFTPWVDASISLNCPSSLYGQQSQSMWQYSSNKAHYLSISYIFTPAAGFHNANSGIINVTPGTGSAEGVGIQISLGDGAVPPGYVRSLSLTYENHHSFIISPGTAQTYRIPFVARYIQTAALLKPGRADGTATFTINYK